jgi:hypothetical protein
MSGGWSVDLKGASTATLVELYELLKESKENRSQAREIQKELVARAKAAGLTTQEIVNALTASWLTGSCLFRGASLVCDRSD